MDDMEQRIAELWAPNMRAWLDQGQRDAELVNRLFPPRIPWYRRLWAALTGGS